MTRFRLARSFPVPATTPAEAGQMTLQMEEALASSTRLWLRGQLLNIPQASVNGKDKRRWARRQDRGAAVPPPLTALETRIGACLLRSEPQLQTDGRFD